MQGIPLDRRAMHFAAMRSINVEGAHGYKGLAPTDLKIFSINKEAICVSY